MKKIFCLTLIISLLMLASLACGGTAPSAVPTPNTQATIDAALAATNSAPNSQATVEAAIAATQSAQLVLQATLGAAMSATATAMPQPTSVPTAEYVSMTEEELAALVNQAVAEASAAAEQASTSTSQATADDSVTQEEVYSVDVYVEAAELAIEYAEEVLGAYQDLYGELATETVAILTEVEQDLEAMAQTNADLNASIDEISASLAQGVALATETIDQFEATAQAASANIDELQAKSQAWATSLQTEIQARADLVAGVKPDNIPSDRLSSLQSAFAFSDGVRAALEDNKLTKQELDLISKLGANASAGLTQHGGAQLQSLSGMIGQITGQLARGQVPHAKRDLGNFEKSLGQRPDGAGGGRPGGGLRP